MSDATFDGPLCPNCYTRCGWIPLGTCTNQAIMAICTCRANAMAQTMGERTACPVHNTIVPNEILSPGPTTWLHPSGQ